MPPWPDQAALGALLLRVTIGGFQIPHGLAKFGLGGNPDQIAEGFAELGLHPPRAWVRVIGAAQILLGVLLVLGVATQGAAVMTACLSVAMARIALRPHGWFWGRHGMEYALFWAAAAAACAMIGPGAWAVTG